MASRDLNDLQPEVRDRALAMQVAADDLGFEFLIYCTLRDENEQARLFRRGRSLAEIQARADGLLTVYHRPDLATLLMEVGPQHGELVTKAGPGQSMHNYGLAFDGCPMLEGKPVWARKTPEQIALWNTYGELGKAMGLEWSGDWRSFPEYPHLQAADADWKDLIRSGP